MSDMYNDLNRPAQSNRDSYILISNSVFTNLNFYTQVNSLAITGATRVTDEYITEVLDGEEFKMP